MSVTPLSAARSGRPRRPTATANFGSSRREGHDASAFYERFVPPEVSDDTTIDRPDEVDVIYTHDARQMDKVASNSVALVVTSPPYFHWPPKVCLWKIVDRSRSTSDPISGRRRRRPGPSSVRSSRCQRRFHYAAVVDPSVGDLRDRDFGGEVQARAAPLPSSRLMATCAEERSPARLARLWPSRRRDRPAARAVERTVAGQPVDTGQRARVRGGPST